MKTLIRIYESIAFGLFGLLTNIDMRLLLDTNADLRADNRALQDANSEAVRQIADLQARIRMGAALVSEPIRAPMSRTRYTPGATVWSEATMPIEAGRIQGARTHAEGQAMQDAYEKAQDEGWRAFMVVLGNWQVDSTPQRGGSVLRMRVSLIQMIADKDKGA